MKLVDGNGVKFSSKSGYVAGVRCEKGHSGNTGLVLHSGDLYECQGCLHYVSAATIRAAQAAAPTQA
jgi:hypothetical protein